MNAYDEDAAVQENEYDAPSYAGDEGTQNEEGYDEGSYHEEGYDEGLSPKYADEPAVAADPDLLADLPLALTLRCGQLTLTLGQLRELGSGSVLEINGVAPGQATLCYGERVVAEGELVDVDGRLGLQITRLASQP
ncbi:MULTISPECIES: FliM/FliN family flagellar motor switch protein [Pseudomonas]|uniref:FliM/FliN family flagellar motor switch protein n=1 Tax=Pseudomonas TaxID=286 RepID=UPI002D21856C|nr:FliM/FliN family flagellar motor switch protein [Pseudomonas sp. LY10J]